MEGLSAVTETDGAPPTVTVTLSDIVPPAGLLHVMVYVFVEVTWPVDVALESALEPDQSPDATHELAVMLAEFHDMVVDAP